ncbi:MAG: NusA N-terminal domain-containing protein, partial [Eubacteriales bacterium]|nr:NusA N-terminal domain-containing protein [Eubacteriales bacterium]
MVNKDFFQALDLLEQEKKISRSKMIEALEAGILFAFKKEYGEARQITVRCDETRNTIKVFAYRNVVETVEDPEKEISLEEAREIKKSYKVGDEVKTEFVPKEFGRIAAQTA